MGAALTDRLVDVESRLLEALSESARGPRRNGTFALWLLVRHCDGLLPPHALNQRVARRRVDQLERRLSSLSLPAPFRRGVGGALRELREERQDGVTLALHQLVAPSREALGVAAAEALTLATRLAREAVQESERES